MGFRPLLAITAVFLLSSAHAFGSDCAHEFKGILQSSISVSSTVITELNAPFKKLKMTIVSEPMVPIGRGAIGEANPHLVQLLEVLQGYQMDVKAYDHEFQAAFHKIPHFYDYRNFYRSRINIFKSASMEWLKQLKAVSPEAAEQSQKVLFEKFRDLNSHLSDLSERSGIEKMTERSTLIHNQITGMLGEMYGLLGFPKVLKSSMRLSEMPEVVQGLDRSIKNVVNDLGTGTGGMEVWERRFPHIFQSPAMLRHLAAGGSTAPEKKLQWIKEWILSKEIDFVRSDQGQHSWLELKTKTHPMSLRDFDRSYSGKSPRTQILEDREILEFLGLKESIRLEYYVTTGMEPEVRNTLIHLGVHPFDFKKEVTDVTPAVH